MFFITVSNGILSKEHRVQIGTAIWEYLWCLDKVTKIDKNGIGWVLGGKPINLSDISTQLGISRMSVSRNLNRLQQKKYLILTHTPYGIRVKLNKAKKIFFKKDEKKLSPELSTSNPHRNKNVYPRNENVEPNKIYQRYNSIINNKEIFLKETKELGIKMLIKQ